MELQKKKFMTILKKGKIIILDIDWQGSKKVKKDYCGKLYFNFPSTPIVFNFKTKISE